MCFSAAASFSLSGVLGVTGAASLARSDMPETRLFAAIPLLFGLQQFAEGVVWATMGALPDLAVHETAVVSFLALALVIWPMWAPFSLWLIEPRGVRRRVLMSFFCFGVIIAIVALRLLLQWEPIAVVAGRSIDYKHATMGFAIPEWALLLAYSIPTVGSFFVSSRTMVRTIGVTLFVSLILAFLIKREALTSVWCFFAAVLSGMILVAVGRMNRTTAVPIMAAETASYG
ncbi:MAG TPA: DUF6629 family protein [Gemmatimonadaceae bacterium]|nr:DUF6629 family protein [Gemmatimonadaceae bacterium]